jgi:salicylate hydroxylase
VTAQVNHRVLVIGAGLGGLAVTLALQRAGIPVAAYEQAPELSEIGAGIMLTPNASRVLQYLGVFDDVVSRALLPVHRRIRHWRTGEVLTDMILDERFQQRYGAQFLTIHRSDLQRALADGVHRQDPAAIQLNHRLVDVEQRDGLVAAKFANGATVTGNALIACDGVRSIVRAKLLHPPPPRFTGNIAWRGLVPIERLGPEARTPDTVNFVGPQRHVVIYAVRQGAFVNYVAIAERATWEEEGWNVPATVDEALRAFAGWHAEVCDLIAATPPDGCFKWGLFDHEPLSRWTSGRVALLGDAAHAMLPFVAQGAAMSLEDAIVLARALREVESVEEALGIYDQARRSRAGWAQQRARFMAELFHQEASGEDLGKERGTVSETLYSYDAATVPLAPAN